MARSTDSDGQRPPRSRGLRHATKVISCGSMTGTAILFPVANVEGLLFRAATLSIFILSGLVFHALHLDPFVRFGPFTAAAGLILLFITVFAAPPPRQDFIPWLPLFMASVSLITVVIYDISQEMRPLPLSVTAEDGFSGVSVDAGGEPSFRSLSVQPSPPSESYRNHSQYFERHGPSSRTSHWTNTNTSDISLSGVAGEVRSQWDAPTRSHFAPADLPNQAASGGPQPRSASPQGESSQAQDMTADREPETDPETDLERDLPMDADSDSEHETIESSRPLLGSH